MSSRPNLYEIDISPISVQNDANNSLSSSQAQQQLPMISLQDLKSICYQENVLTSSFMAFFTLQGYWSAWWKMIEVYMDFILGEKNQNQI